MQHHTLLGQADVLRLRLELQAHPELWDQNIGRTGYEGSPHRDVSDIWLRWRPPERRLDVDLPSHNEPFAELQWYPAMQYLPSTRGILLDIMHRVGGLAMGGTLITRIPPGGSVKPHTDEQSWHAQYYRTKVYCVIQTNNGVCNVTAGEVYVPGEGDVFSFDNTLVHSVHNEGNTDRVTMMTAIRCE